MNSKFIIVFILLSTLFLSGCNSLYWHNEIEEECVKEKWIKGHGESSQKYLIGMKSGRVYQITDSLMKWNWESSNIYNKIDEGQCYDVTYFGWRIGLFSTYHVIDEVSEK